MKYGKSYLIRVEELNQSKKEENQKSEAVANMINPFVNQETKWKT